MNEKMDTLRLSRAQQPAMANGPQQPAWSWCNGDTPTTLADGVHNRRPVTPGGRAGGAGVLRPAAPWGVRDPGVDVGPAPTLRLHRFGRMLFR